MIVLFAFLHHLAAFTLVAAVAVEFVLLKGDLTLWSARRLQVADMVFGIAATILLLAGLGRVFWFEKGAAYYFHSHAFTAKFSIFVAIGFVLILERSTHRRVGRSVCLATEGHDRNYGEGRAS